MWRSNFFPRKLSFTREGRIIVVISTGLGFAAVNTGNNLIYVVFGLSLGLILISGFLSESNIRRIVPSRMPRLRAQASRPATFLLSANNGNTRRASFGVEIWPLFDGDDVKVEPAVFTELPAGTERDGPASVTFPRRGEYRMHGMVVSTEFPFSFFRKSAVTPAGGSVIVHPVIRELRDVKVPPGSEGEEESLPRPGRGYEFFGVRDFRVGDNPRNISHRLSAARGQTIVREFEQTGNHMVFIALVNSNPGGDDGGARVETAIEKAASVAVHLLGNGRVVGLVTYSGVVAPGSGPAQADRILDHLAVLPVLELNPPGEEIQIRGLVADENPGGVIWIRP